MITGAKEGHQGSFEQMHARTRFVSITSGDGRIYCSVVHKSFIVLNDYWNEELFPYIHLIKEMATSFSLTSKETKGWTSPLFIATFYNSWWHMLFLELFFKLHCFLILGKCFLWALRWGAPGGCFRQWGTQPRRSPGPCHCRRRAHTPRHLENDSSDPPPLTLGRCWLTNPDLNFSNCLESESEPSPHRPGKGSWTGMMSYSHCSPGECWLCCCLRWKTPSVCWAHFAYSSL